MEQIVDLQEGLRHPVWGKVFGHKFGGRSNGPAVKRTPPDASAKIKSYKPKSAMESEKDAQDDSEDDERNSDLEAPIKRPSWYNPVRFCV